MTTPTQYRRFAEECRRLAQQVESDRHRLVLHEMASAWEALADETFEGQAAPAAGGVVEIGYTIVPSRRRQGYASEAAAGMWRWAARHGARVLRASISPDNGPSLALIHKAGFVEGLWFDEPGHDGGVDTVVGCTFDVATVIG